MPTAVYRDRLAELIGQRLQRRFGGDRRQRFQITFVRGLRQRGPPRQVGDALPQRSPFSRALRIPVRAAIRFQLPRVVDRGLDAQHGGLLVVHLDGVLSGAVFDAHAFDPPFQIAADFAEEVSVHPSMCWQLAAPEPQHVGALKCFEAAPQPPRIELRQRRRVAEQQVRGPFGLLALIANCKPILDRVQKLSPCISATERSRRSYASNFVTLSTSRSIANGLRM